jgi:hypothetical protein
VGTIGAARLANDIPEARAVTAIVSRVEIAEALQVRDRLPELFLEIDREGEERSTVSMSWSHDELEELFDRAIGEDILLSFDSDELMSAFDDVEAHGFRRQALVFTVATAGVLGSGSAIANAAPTIERNSSGTASVATRSSGTEVTTRDVTEVLVVGGVLLAIAGATFAGVRRGGAAHPA